ncbi:30S ribosomal protein S17 [candidate division WWE3 bacterium RIFCSPHIGHO2_01_FULL_48_15]|uniref:30S ribosomal protein S17 n=1 Tax=candidate division WWE3 bacterium RIFCSPHIGHO2_01_FULL_48_15 TaxID=1802619 RepID=A0A1F4V9U7_UNCKA|nr:MAG: 30S ribosomal protein S17 [candidate division WWE3 bacterium RIFCSPHIGHO2_01_FULL_48_15]
MPRKQLKGKIKSISGAKTVVVEVTRFYHHPLYRKRLSTSKRYLAHVETEVSAGQEVMIEEIRPLSARKRWKVVEVEGKSVFSEQKTATSVEKVRVKRTSRKEKPDH